MMKPKYRGVIHRFAFIITCCIGIMYLILCINGKFNLGITIYILSQLSLFGISSTYHLHNWKSSKYQKIFQKLDHMSIFFLISGTQTSVILLFCNRMLKKMLAITWSFFFIGVSKIILMDYISEFLNIFLYVAHGVSLLPYILQNISSSDLFLFILGGTFYVVGGIIFGMHRPELFPGIFGYHEIFHAFTVLANLCFMIPIFDKYLRN